MDARDGKVAIHGWRTITDIDAYEFVSRLPSQGVDTVIYTDISRDGMLQGANLPAYEKLNGIEGLNVVASGGIGGFTGGLHLKRRLLTVESIEIAEKTPFSEKFLFTFD